MKKVFSNDEAVFSHNDVPAAARDAKSSVRQWKKPNILHTTKVEWNTSTVTPEKLCKRSNRQLAVHDRREFAYNYRAEVLPEPVELVQDGFVFPRVRSALAATKRAEEMPVNPKLLDKPTWDNSTSVDFKEKEFKVRCCCCLLPPLAADARGRGRSLRCAARVSCSAAPHPGEPRAIPLPSVLLR